MDVMKRVVDGATNVAVVSAKTAASLIGVAASMIGRVAGDEPMPTDYDTDDHDDSP